MLNTAVQNDLGSNALARASRAIKQEMLVALAIGIVGNGGAGIGIAKHQLADLLGRMAGQK